jgi:hypothetical protein
LYAPPIAEFNEYLPPLIRRALLKQFATPVPAVRGLHVVGPVGENPLERWRDVLSTDALAFVVAVYRASLQFAPNITLSALLKHRKSTHSALRSSRSSPCSRPRVLSVSRGFG